MVTTLLKPPQDVGYRLNKFVELRGAGEEIGLDDL